MQQQMVDDLRNFVINNFMLGVDGGKLKDDLSFMESGIIDSTGVLELVTHLEKKYKIKIEDNELVPENLDSINKLKEFLCKKVK